MSWLLVAGVALAVISVAVSMMRAGDDIRWGLTSGLISALVVMVVLAWAKISGLV